MSYRARAMLGQVAASQTMSVSDVQKALTVASAQDHSIPSPGTIDNIWGQNTRASFERWQDKDLAHRGTASYPPSARATTMQLYPETYALLYSLARIYDAERSARPVTTPSPAPVTSIGPNTIPGGDPIIPDGSDSVPDVVRWLLVGIGAVGIGTAAYLIWHEGQRLRVPKHRFARQRFLDLTHRFDSRDTVAANRRRRRRS